MKCKIKIGSGLISLLFWLLLVVHQAQISALLLLVLIDDFSLVGHTNVHS